MDRATLRLDSTLDFGHRVIDQLASFGLKHLGKTPVLPAVVTGVFDF
ncbi:MAG TPA: hypothetical protein VGO66_12025 [Solirubrobacterales bacterium]|nr:hypothetical protein [Solirubrobacterales bacterium]